MSWARAFDRPLLLVSGKGGTGKSTVAAAVAALAAGEGRRVLLAEVEGRGEIARTLEVPDPGMEERPTPLGFSVLSIDSSAAAVEYLQLFSGMERVTRAIAASGALEQMVGGAPGLRDLLICGKLYEIVRLRPQGHPRTRGRPRYDLVIVDAPPTGQIVTFVSAPSAFAELFRGGRMRRQAESIAAFLRSEARVLLTATPEEMAVAETLEAIPALARARVTVGPIVANRCLPEVFPSGTRAAFRRLQPRDLRRTWAAAGVSVSPEEAGIAQARAEAIDARRMAQRRFVRNLSDAAPTLELLELGGLSGRSLIETLASAMDGSSPDESAADVGAMPPTPPPPLTGLDAPLDGARVVVACGSGGVGKTTISAALAVRLAPRGGRAALLTIDPARRLATALRLPAVAGDRVDLPVGRRARLEVMQLDTQRTFDGLVERYGGTQERKDRILSNRFYRRIADTLAGTHEYMAMEKLYELAEEEEHDLIVIDTPPTRSALSFLDAPRRLTDFLGGRVLRWILRPSLRAGRLTLSVARLGAGAFLRGAGRLLGSETLGDTVEFLAAFEGMYGGFAERADRVMELLRSERCAFVVVAAPSRASMEEAGHFVNRLTESGMRPAAMVVNRWDAGPSLTLDGAPAAVATLERGTVPQRAAAAVLAAAVRAAPKQRAEAGAVAGFLAEHGDIPVVTVPELSGDVHDVAGLRGVGELLFERGGG
ncbi:MAG TPA: ArsA-related P-loop ATPase [Actinomycetota bacterium]|nr:ArsA-related P-loop ATPase [Actinomycetota bacterium]